MYSLPDFRVHLIVFGKEKVDSAPQDIAVSIQIATRGFAQVRRIRLGEAPRKDIDLAPQTGPPIDHLSWDYAGDCASREQVKK